MRRKKQAKTAKGNRIQSAKSFASADTRSTKNSLAEVELPKVTPKSAAPKLKPTTRKIVLYAL